jgi:hydroxymethylpyrimidine/phosphomethylpyrimidine kinase
MEPPVAISIAGSDNSAGAGIQADLKTFTHFKVFGQTVVTCVVAEVPGRVAIIHPIDPETVRMQLALSLESFPVRTVKTGMLYSAQIIETVCDVLRALPAESRPQLVIDPVMAAATGDPLLEPAAIAAYRDQLMPLASLVTPNIDEACRLTDRPIRNVTQLEEVGRLLTRQFKVPFLVKGGHLGAVEAIDILFVGESLKRFSAPYQSGILTHGTGCTLSAAIAANLALGRSLEEAVQISKDYVTRAIRESLTWKGPAGDVAALKHWAN